MGATTDITTGAITYKAPLKVSDVTLDGVSVMALDPIEIMVQADGWGYVCLLVNPVTRERKTQVDGQHRNYTLWGDIVVSLI